MYFYALAMLYYTIQYRQPAPRTKQNVGVPKFRSLDARQLYQAYAPSIYIVWAGGSHV